jgi:hypothetical protein
MYQMFAFLSFEFDNIFSSGFYENAWVIHFLFTYFLPDCLCGYLSYIHLGSSVCHPVCRPVVFAER